MTSANDYQPRPEHKFSFGLWTVGNWGRDAFGDFVRPLISPIEIVSMLAEVGAWGVNLHDNDLVPIDATTAERDCMVRSFKKACETWESRFSKRIQGSTEAGRMVSIWFFIGISLAVNGGLILAAGIYQLVNPPANPGVVLFQLHANVWWGALLLLFGLMYCFKFAPKRQA